ncbi:magnesium transporter [Sesbania bispinosa]|nr:magnesium transporter [Sesbania bispinosa]
MKVKHVSGCMYEWLEDDLGPSAQERTNEDIGSVGMVHVLNKVAPTSEAECQDDMEQGA